MDSKVFPNLNAPEFPTLPLVMKRDELAKRIFDGRLKAKNYVADGTAISGDKKLSMKQQALSITEISLNMSRARIVLWRQDLLDVALSNSKNFSDTIFPAYLLPSMPMWFPGDNLLKARHYKDQLSRDLTSKNTDAERAMSVFRLQGILLYTGVSGGTTFDGDSVQSIATGLVVIYVMKLDDRLAYTVMSLDVGHKIAFRIRDSEPGAQEMKSECAAITSMLSFMKSEFIQNKTIRMPKRFDGFRNPYVPCINQVLLRERKDIIVPGSQADAKPDKKWHHCWTVQTHTRNLGHPRKSDGQQVVWVKAHVKGDEAKPMLPPRDTIIRVNR